MKCSINGCPGEYEPREILHTVRHQGEVRVIDQVPAEVCDICGDVLLTPETVRGIERILRERPTADRSVPLVEFS